MPDQNNNCYEFLTKNGEACGKACQEIYSKIIKKHPKYNESNILYYNSTINDSFNKKSQRTLQ